MNKIKLYHCPTCNSTLIVKDLLFSCVDCHQFFEKDDAVIRTYLLEEDLYKELEDVIHRIGEPSWNGENYVAERERLEQQAIRDKKMGDKGIVTEMNREIFQLEQEYDERLQDEIDRDNFDMGMIPDDGDFDPDDVGAENDIYANY